MESQILGCRRTYALNKEKERKELSKADSYAYIKGIITLIKIAKA